MTNEILRLWRENGATLDVEHKDSFDRTPLHYTAFFHGHGEACRALVSTCCANIDSRTLWGETPLIFNVFNKNIRCVEVLLELGADITLRDNRKERTALEWARKRGFAEIIALLESASMTLVKSANKV
jgi:ankyrin repeat protein